MRRLCFFPTPYPDECLYSIFARYYVRSGINSSKEATMEFFDGGFSLLPSTVFLPRKMERMDYWFDPLCGFTREDLICSHTSYPYQSIIYSEEMCQEMDRIIQEGVPESGTYSIENRMIQKYKFSLNKHQYLRYCPECAQMDICTYGETYWHRLHQLPGVKICPKHGCNVRNSKISITKLHPGIYPASYILRNEMTIFEKSEQPNKEQYIKIAEDTQWLLEHGRKFGGYQNIKRKYFGFLRERGYVNYYGQCWDKGLIKRDFLDYFDEKLLKDLFWKVEDPLYWVNYLFGAGFQHLQAIQHVLLMEFFSHSAEDFYRSDMKMEIPFDSELEPCINKICPQYTNNTAKRVGRRIVGPEIWAWFECSYCGMRYRRSNPTQTFEEYQIQPCVTDRGFLFTKELHKYLVETDLSQTAIANKLGVSRDVVGKYARDHGICKYPEPKSSYYRHYKKKMGNDEDATTYYRRRVMEELEKTPILSCRDLNERIPGAYSWLLKKDPKWIHSVLTSEYNKPKWEEWGKTSLIRLKEAYIEILNQGNSRKRMTLGRIARAAGIDPKVIWARLPYILILQQFFAEVCESREAWIRRRCTEIAMQKKNNGGKEFSYYDIQKGDSHLGRLRFYENEKNKEMIDSLIRELNITIFHDKRID